MFMLKVYVIWFEQAKLCLIIARFDFTPRITHHELRVT